MKTAVRERPINLSSWEVRAIWDGKKTQLRRVILPQPKVIHAMYTDGSLETNCIFRTGDQRIHCPFGVPGDRLWVRETWLPCVHGNYEPWTRGDGRPADAYEAFIQFKEQSPLDEYKKYWRSPTSMPRFASRLTLDVTDVRVQRVQQISEEDAIAEGCADYRNYEVYPSSPRSLYWGL